MKTKALNVLAVIFGLLFINGGANKIFNYIPVPENLPAEVMKDSAAMMEIQWLMPLVAVVELIGGILVLFPKTRALGALMLVPIMVGILLNHIFADPANLIIPIVLAVIMVWMIYADRHKFMPLLNK